MELFKKETNIDFLSKQWLTLGISAVLVLATIASLALKGGPKWGIDFRGGALVYVKFAQQPPVDEIRRVVSAALQGEVNVTTSQETATSKAEEVIIGTEAQDEKALDQARYSIAHALEDKFGAPKGKLDLNNAGQQAVADRLREPLQRAGAVTSEQDLQNLTAAMLAYRDKERSGVLTNLDELKSVPGATPAVMGAVQQECGLAKFAIRQVEIVGPKAGADLRRQALMATLFALGGMLVYIAFRFELIAGVAAVVAIIHDTLITVGFFSWFDREINLTIIAALLTLIGYSMNDKIVVFDRVRENLKTMARMTLPVLVNKSINQTLSRTLLTAGPTLLCTLALYFLGGAVLEGIAYALFIGIIVGTYSSIFIASSILVFWQSFKDSRRRAAIAAPAGKTRKG
jgi:preprotein translocase subunit SecF